MACAALQGVKGGDTELDSVALPASLLLAVCKHSYADGRAPAVPVPSNQMAERKQYKPGLG